MPYVNEMYQLSPLELDLAIRGAEAQNTLEYMFLVCKGNTISQENQLDAIRLADRMKNDPELLRDAQHVLEKRRQKDYENYLKNLTREKKAEDISVKTAGEKSPELSGSSFLSENGFKQYVASKIDLSEYERKNPNNVLECYRIFKEEKADEIRVHGENKAFHAWLGGLCPALPVAFEEPEQKKILNDFKIAVPSGKEISDVFYTSVTSSFMDLVADEKKKSLDDFSQTSRSEKNSAGIKMPESIIRGEKDVSI